MSRFLTVAFASCLVAYAQIAAQDSRNTDIPDVDTHFVPRTYKTLAEGESRKQALRNKISPLHGYWSYGRLETTDIIGATRYS